MQKEQFEIIENNLKKRISQCEEKLDHILTADALTNITIKEFMELQTFCREEQIDMTEILMVDLYHVLGMGKLTLQQRNTFLSLINKYATYRSDMKCICTMKEISDINKLPSISKFKLHKLGDVTLQSAPRGVGRILEVLDESSEITDYREAKQMDKLLISSQDTFQYKSVIILGKTITCDMADAKELIKTLAENSSVDTLIKCCNKKKNYCDIMWTWSNDRHTQLSGVFLTDVCRNNIIKKLKAKAQ